MEKPKIVIEHLTFAYGRNRVLNDVCARFDAHRITAIVGPSGKGKSTFLTVLNRLWEDIPGASRQGRVAVFFDGAYRDIYAPSCSLPELRRRVGMVFQTPNPLPMSVFKNVAFPLKLKGLRNKTETAGRVEEALQKAFLWDEVRDRLHRDGRTLSGGQQQRLCMARALVLEPEVLLLDEPTSSLDQKAGEVIEDLLVGLKAGCTILMVSHYRAQVQRIADAVVELKDGRLVRQPDFDCAVKEFERSPSIGR